MHPHSKLNGLELYAMPQCFPILVQEDGYLLIHNGLELTKWATPYFAPTPVQEYVEKNIVI